MSWSKEEIDTDQMAVTHHMIESMLVASQANLFGNKDVRSIIEAEHNTNNEQVIEELIEKGYVAEASAVFASQILYIIHDELHKIMGGAGIKDLGLYTKAMSFDWLNSEEFAKKYKSLPISDYKKVVGAE